MHKHLAWMAIAVAGISLSGTALFAQPAEYTIGISDPGTDEYQLGGLRLFFAPGETELGAEVTDLQDLVIDHAGEFGYACNYSAPGKVIKFRLRPFERIGAIDLPDGNNYLWSASVIDPTDEYAYFTGLSSPARITKVDLSTFTVDSTITMEAGENHLISGLIEPDGSHAYFTTGAGIDPGKMIRIDLETFSRDGTLTFESGEYDFQAAVMDSQGKYAYLGTGDYTFPAKIVKVDLETFERVAAITLPESGDQEYGFYDGEIAPDDSYAYFCTYKAPGRIVRVELSSFQSDAEVTIPNANRVLQMAIDPEGNFLTCSFLMDSSVHGGFAKIDLNDFVYLNRLGLSGGPMTCMDITPDGTMVFVGANRPEPSLILPFTPSQKGYVKMTKVEVTQPTVVESVGFYHHAPIGTEEARLAIYDDGSPRTLLWQSDPLPAQSTPNSSFNTYLNAPDPLVLGPGHYHLAWQVNTSADIPSFHPGGGGEGSFYLRSFGEFPGEIAATDIVGTNEKWTIWMNGREYIPPDDFHYAFNDDAEGWTFMSPSEFTASTGEYIEQTSSLAITPGDNLNSFALWQSLSIKTGNSVDADIIEEETGDTLYSTSFGVSSSLKDPATVPTLRLRMTTGDQSRSDIVVITSAGDGSYSPVIASGNEGMPYSLLGLKPEDADSFRLFFETLNFESESNDPATLYLHANTTQAYPDNVKGSEVIARFNSDSPEWDDFQFITAPPLDGPGIHEKSDALVIGGIAASRYESPTMFGCWTLESDVTAQAFWIYEIEWTVSTDACDECGPQIPVVRLRVNTSSQQFSGYTNLHASQAATPLPTASEGQRTIRTHVLTDFPLEGESLIFSFDYLYTPDVGHDPSIRIYLHDITVY